MVQTEVVRTSKQNNIPYAAQKFPGLFAMGNALLVPFILFVLLANFAYATDPVSSATALSNGGNYNFGDWTRFAVQMTVYCNAGTSDCNSTLYCIDTSNSCNASAGTAYNSSINISTEGTSYIRYASNSSNGTLGDTSSSTVKIDFSNPSISISDDASLSWTNNDTISATVTDSVSGIGVTKWVARSDSACNTTQDSEIDSNGTTGAAMYADDESKYLNKYICFRTSDSAGNRNYTVSSQITKLDTAAPAVDAGSDKTTNAQFAQGAAASDSESGIATYFWSKTSGPGTVTFGSRDSKDTTISADTDGTYVIGVNVTDNAGNNAYDSFTLYWSTTAPAISVSNPGNALAQSKTLGASASKGTLTMSITTGTACDNSLSFVSYSSTTFSSESDNGKRICYRSIDDAGNAAYLISNPISGIAVAKPVITLIGNSDVSVEAGGSYSDSGASATDNYDGDITSKIVVNNQVSPNVVGTYTVTYDVADSSGKKAQQMIRTVRVVDTTRPVITLIGNSTINIESGAVYVDEGAKASDNYEGDITSRIVVRNPVNSSVVGAYNITYDVTDSSGNQANRVIRTVNVNGSSVMLILIAGAAVVGLVVLAGIGVGAYILYKKHKRGGL